MEVEEKEVEGEAKGGMFLRAASRERVSIVSAVKR